MAYPHQEDKHYWAKIQYIPCRSNSSVGQHGFKENSTLLTMGPWYVNCASQPVNQQLLTIRPSETKSVWHHKKHINTNLVCTKGKKMSKDTDKKVKHFKDMHKTEPDRKSDIIRGELVLLSAVWKPIMDIRQWDKLLLNSTNIILQKELAVTKWPISTVSTTNGILSNCEQSVRVH